MFPESYEKDLGPDCGSEWGQSWGKAWGAQEVEITDLRCLMHKCCHVLRQQSSEKKKSKERWFYILAEWYPFLKLIKFTKEDGIFITCWFLQIIKWLMHWIFGSGYQIAMPVSLATCTNQFPNILLKEHFISSTMRNASHRKICD